VDGVDKAVTCLGDFDSLSGRIQRIRVTADVRGFDSGNASRDKTAMNSIEAGKFPETTFGSDRFRVRFRMIFDGIR